MAYGSREKQEEVRMAYDRDRRASRLIGGLILVALGCLFLLQNLGVLYVGSLWRFWPMFLVWGGLEGVVAPRRSLHFAGGAVMLILGVFFQLQELGFLFIRARDFWPALLVVAGLALLAQSFLSRRNGGYGPASGPGSRS